MNSTLPFNPSVRMTARRYHHLSRYLIRLRLTRLLLSAAASFGHCTFRALHLSGIVHLGHHPFRASFVSGIVHLGHRSFRASFISGIVQVGHRTYRASYMSGTAHVGHCTFRALHHSGIWPCRPLLPLASDGSICHHLPPSCCLYKARVLTLATVVFLSCLEQDHMY
jgi:hypothetical protein